MNLTLSDLIIQPGWTVASQLCKCQEELDEIKEAAVNGDDVNVIKETLDLIQTGHTLLQMLNEHYDNKLNIGKFLDEHEAKLRRKGYL